MHTLDDAYGQEQILADYLDDPVDPCCRQNIDPDYYISNLNINFLETKLIHGHFSPRKYSDITQATWITFLREPVENIISIYNFWRQLPKGSHILHDYFLENKLSLIDMARLPALRFLYSKSYFAGFDMERFDFIGDYAHYKPEVERLSALLGISLRQDIFKNKTPQKERERVDQTELKEILKQDIEFYQKYKGQ